MTTTFTTLNASNGSEEALELRKGPWTFEEDNILIQNIACHGQGQWNTLAKYSGLKRSGKSCRLRWLNYLKPDIKRGNLTIQEQLMILELQSKFGNRWSKIAQQLPGRTDNEIKNYWRTRVQKQARQLKLDSDSNKFIEAVRYFWMPRLIEQMEQKSSSPLSSYSFHSTYSPEAENQGPSVFSPIQPTLDKVDQCYDNPALVTNSISKKLISTNCLCPSSTCMDGSGNDMESFNLDATPGVQSCGSHVAGNYWFIDEMASTVREMDEVWWP